MLSQKLTLLKVRSCFLAFTGEGHVTPLPFYYGSAKADPFGIPPLRSAQKQELTFLISLEQLSFIFCDREK